MACTCAELRAPDRKPGDPFLLCPTCTAKMENRPADVRWCAVMREADIDAGGRMRTIGDVPDLSDWVTRMLVLHALAVRVGLDPENGVHFEECDSEAGWLLIVEGEGHIFWEREDEWRRTHVDGITTDDPLLALALACRATREAQ